MKRTLALLIVGVVACEGHNADQIRFVDDVRTAPRLACKPSDLELEGSRVAELKSVGKDSLIAVFPDDRRVALLDGRLQPIWEVAFEKEGPRGVGMPISAAILDSVLYVADQQKPKLRRFTLSGHVLTDLQLDFLPAQLVTLPDRIGLIPGVVGRYPNSLLYYYLHDKVIDAKIPTAEYSNVSVKMLGNFMSVAALNSRMLLIHQFLTTRAYVRSGNGVVSAKPIAINSSFRRDVGYVPPLPLDDKALERVLAVGLSAAADPVASRFLVLTRSGKRIGDRFEKAVFQFDSAFNYMNARVLPVNAGMIAYLSGSRSLVAIDEDYNWFACPLP